MPTICSLVGLRCFARSLSAYAPVQHALTCRRWCGPKSKSPCRRRACGVLGCRTSYPGRDLPPRREPRPPMPLCAHGAAACRGPGLTKGAACRCSRRRSPYLCPRDPVCRWAPLDPRQIEGPASPPPLVASSESRPRECPQETSPTQLPHPALLWPQGTAMQNMPSAKVCRQTLTERVRVIHGASASCLSYQACARRFLLPAYST